MADQTPANLGVTAIRTMEPAIIARLRKVFPEKYFAIERVPSVMTLGEFDRVSRQAPFIGLAWTGMKADGQSGRVLTGEMTWRLWMIVRANTLDTRFKGDARDVGLDAMVDLATGLLQGVTFDGIGLCSVTAANAAYAEGHGDDHTACAQVEFSIRYTSSPRAFEIFDGEDFEQINVAWLTTDGDPPAADPGVTQTIPMNEEEA